MTATLRFEDKIDQNTVESRVQFVARQHYGEWNASMFSSESFDSYSGEFMLAELLDKSPDITWWKRLYRHEQAYIYYTIDLTLVEAFGQHRHRTTQHSCRGVVSTGHHGEGEAQNRQQAGHVAVFTESSGE